MKPTRIDLLRRVFEAENEGADMCHINLHEEDKKGLRVMMSDAKELVDEGYLTEPIKATWQLNLRLTEKGWNFADNGFMENEMPMVNGNGNCVVIGTGNKVSHNYNPVQLQISEADIPQEIKNEILTLLEDVKGIQNDSCKLRNRIGGFLENITAGTISNIAAPGVISLLQALIQNIPM